MAIATFQLAIVVFVATLGAGAGGTAALARSQLRETSRWQVAVLICGTAALTGIGVLALAGAVARLPGLGVAAMLALLASSPPVVSRLLSRRADLRLRASRPARLDDTELCAACQLSSTMLADAQFVTKRVAVVARRGLLLDELETRHPRQFTRWLADGPRAADDPAAYFDVT